MLIYQQCVVFYFRACFSYVSFSVFLYKGDGSSGLFRNARCNMVRCVSSGEGEPLALGFHRGKPFVASVGTGFIRSPVVVYMCRRLYFSVHVHMQTIHALWNPLTLRNDIDLSSSNSPLLINRWKGHWATFSSQFTFNMQLCPFHKFSHIYRPVCVLVKEIKL